MGRAEGNKKPRIVSGAGFLGVLSCFVFAWTRTLTRTSAGNKKYEYEDEHEATQRDNATGRRSGGADQVAGRAALRHGPTLNESR